jgi:subtilisin family serine protease
MPSLPFPNDPLYTQSGEDDLFTAGQWNMRKVRAVDAWRIATGAGITVADLDSGLDLTHPDFACPGKISVVASSDPFNGDSDPEDDDGHGTHTAGIIGACTNNGIGVVGVAPDATIMPIKVLGADGKGTEQVLATGIRTATDAGAYVINMSMSFGVAPYTGTALGFAGQYPRVSAALDYAASQGVVIVASAGNSSSALCDYPAFAAKVVCVGASDPNDLNAYYSNAPVKVEDGSTGAALLAPGGAGAPFCASSSFEIISTYDRGVATNCDGIKGYEPLTGTSMAAPLVSGVAALVYQRLGATRSPANAARVVEAIIRSADDLYTPGWDPMSGAGRLDAYRAARYWSASCAHAVACRPRQDS